MPIKFMVCLENFKFIFFYIRKMLNVLLKFFGGDYINIIVLIVFLLMILFIGLSFVSFSFLIPAGLCLLTILGLRHFFPV